MFTFWVLHLEQNPENWEAAVKFRHQSNYCQWWIMPHYGFNFQWMFSWKPQHNPEAPDEAALDFMAQFGFSFVRIPMDYHFWPQNFDYFHPDEHVFESIDSYLAACRT